MFGGIWVKTSVEFSTQRKPTFFEIPAPLAPVQ